MTTHLLRPLAALLLGLALTLPTRLAAQSTVTSSKVLYNANFELAQGFDPKLTVAGQDGWVASDDGGSGLVESGRFINGGQQAFIGFNPPNGKTNDFLSLWRPINYTPAATNGSVLKFSVQMQILPSQNGGKDDFRWSAYNVNGNRLFSLDFNTLSLLISYGLDDTNAFASTGFAFDTLGSYVLTIWMDFTRNQWSALLNDTFIANSKAITTTGVTLDFGDMDAVWAIRQPGSPGDNYMLFDDYRVTVEGVTSIPSRLEILDLETNGVLRLKAACQAGLKYAIETSQDMKIWSQVKTFIAPPGGELEFDDRDLPATTVRYFRLVQLR
ncbi:MAG: hypothetical protein EXS31_05800 [Pedosphaera sp.]|nr:hypothetical protein [Pedosphaera sp.]